MQYTKYNIEEIKEKLKNCLSEERFLHSIGTMEKAVELAQRFHCDIEKAIGKRVKLLTILLAEFPDNLVVDAVDNRGTNDDDVVLAPVDSFTYALHHFHHVAGASFVLDGLLDGARNACGVSGMAVIGH